MSFGRLFQTSGAAVLKSLAPAAVLERGTVRLLRSAARSDRPGRGDNVREETRKPINLVERIFERPFCNRNMYSKLHRQQM